MEPLNKEKIDTPKLFIVAGLILLLLALAFGLLGAVQYVVPGFLKANISFEKTRPLHVSSAVFWILLAAMGCVLTYGKEIAGKAFRPGWMPRAQLVLFLAAIVLILYSYLAGLFGGREYWEFPPVITVLIAGGWMLFAITYLRAVPSLKRQPVYVWMWLTGTLGFLFTLSESYLWLIPYFTGGIVRDMTIQWKSYGSMVGCWNMLVYGVGIYLMQKLSQDRFYAHSKISFSLFFLGLFNLLFNWGHHIYTLPVAPYIKHIGYLVSMTELFILGRIIYSLKDTLSAAQKFKHVLSYRFLMFADAWIFVNLALAIAISVPAINVYTHGTHITVAHVMGTTIGINTMLLLAAAFDILGNSCHHAMPAQHLINRASWIVNGALVVFMVVLLFAGVHRAQWQMDETPAPFSQMMHELRYVFIGFAVSGFALFIGFCGIVIPLLRSVAVCYIKRQPVALSSMEASPVSK